MGARFPDVRQRLSGTPPQHGRRHAAARARAREVRTAQGRFQRLRVRERLAGAARVRARQRVPARAAGHQSGGLWPARVSELAALGVAERIVDAVPAQVLRERQPRRLHPVHDRRRAEAGRRGQDARRAEEREGAGQLPQRVHVRAGREEGWHPAHSRVRGRREGRVLQHQERDARRSARRAPRAAAVARHRAEQFGRVRHAGYRRARVRAQ
ncbi:Uncharacterised protein [Burkholderia pseudomallei]|nr:Uncharacterised protein [Burkholderia pseudomallei]